jgi:hypothetical protein
LVDIEERLRLVDAEIVDEDVDLGKPRHQRGTSLCRTEIERRGVRFG